MFFWVYGPVFGGSPDRVHVNVRAQAKWEDNAEGQWKNEGTVWFHIVGTMVRDASKSRTVQRKGEFFTPMLTYTMETMNVTYGYDEKHVSLRRDGADAKCKSPVLNEFHGRGASRIPDGAAGLSVRMFSSMAAPTLKNLTPAQRQFLAQVQNSAAMPDHYQFYVGGPGSAQQLEGRKRTFKNGVCTYVPARKKLSGFSIGLQMKLPRSGNMSGERTWTADSQGRLPPSLSIRISDMQQQGKTGPYKPAEGGRRNVTYTVSWHLGDKVEVSTGPQPEEKPKKEDCEKLKNRIDFIKIVLKTYADQSLRDSVKARGGTHEDYQAEVEKRVMAEASGTSDNPPKAQPLMWTTPTFSDSEGNHVSSVEIDGKVNGANRTLIKYDSKGNQVDDTDAFWDMQKAWEDAFGEEAGQCMFKAAVRHEECHVRQYVEKGKVKGIDDRAERELEGFKTELKDLEQSYRDNGC